MGRTELAANLFRVTQTEERIKNKGVSGQRNLEQTHFAVGKDVREIVQKNTGQKPENLEQEKRLPEVKKELKQGYRKMLKQNSKKRKIDFWHFSCFVIPQAGHNTFLRMEGS